ncbi:MAG: Acetyltransferase [Phenylobacterium sp.]|jgi:GNAT superfamily N-acetyltransferase|nr:Acetyltransferase [Phenylobacterium sp.]
MTDLSPLDNPIWSALTSAHGRLARRQGLAARYPGEVSPLAGLAELSAEAFADLRALVEPGEPVALFTTGPVEAPGGWDVLRALFIDQMVCVTAPAVPAHEPFQPLGADDVPDMLALTAATEPGPFSRRTIEMGRYLGVRSADGRLAAMAGQRLALDGFTEVSAVCTDPAFRGHGYAKALVARLASEVIAGGKLAFLHVKTENGAKVVYQKLGFEVRRPIQFTVLSPR